MRSDWLVYAIIGIGLLILFLCLFVIKPSKEGFQATIPTVMSIDPDIITKNLRDYFIELGGQYAIDEKGNRKVTELVLKTSQAQSYSYPDIDYIKKYIYSTYLIGATRNNKYTGDLELINSESAENIILKTYNNTYIGGLETILYGTIKSVDSRGNVTRNEKTGLITIAAENDKNAVLQLKSEYSQKVLEYNTAMRQLYDEMMKL